MTSRCGMCSTTKEALTNGITFCPRCDRRRCESCTAPESDVHALACTSCGATYHRGDQ